VSHRPWPLPQRPWIWRQRWLDLLFAHWPIPASVARAVVPAPLTVQEFEGTCWLGLVPFRMEDVMFRGLPAVPYLSAFPEMNLRLYVEHAGRPGVWFVSLDAANMLAVWGARQFAHLPYFHASMTVTQDSDSVTYQSERTNDSPRRVVFRGAYWPTSPVFEARAGTLDHFLTERYRLYTIDDAGRLVTIDIHHQPWPLQRASADIDENTVGTAQGFPVAGAPLLHFSRRQDVVGWRVTMA
jgi:uncharacterized protein YqjF (DUF2071 family)